MAHVAWHVATAVPFAVAGQWDAAVVAVAIDAPWVVQELRFRASGLGSWHSWVQRDGALSRPWLIAYRWLHSFVTWYTVTMVAAWAWGWERIKWMSLAYLVHLLLDLPTHWGPLQQQPLFPITQWRWPYVLRRTRAKFDDASR